MLQAALALILVGDYLMLSVSRLLLGANANWLLLVGLAQVGILGWAILSGQARAVRLGVPLLGCVGLGLVMLGHGVADLIVPGSMTPYGQQKVLTYFGLAGPGFLLGCILGQQQRLPSGALVAAWMLPLLLMCGIAMATDPGAMTIDRADNLAVYLGILVLPVHQALAFSLGKIALWWHARLSASRASNPGVRALWGLGVAFCVGMSIWSGSRGYLVAAVVGLGAQWLFGTGRIGPPLVLLAAAAALYALASESVRDGLDFETIAQSASVQDRADLFAASFDAFCTAPWFGQGPGGFAVFYGWHDRVYPHNLFLEVLSEFGLVGAGFLLMILLPALTRALRRAWSGHLSEVQCFAVGYLLFALVGAMGIADLIRNHFVFLAAGMAAVSCASVTPVAAPSTSVVPEAPPRPAPRTS